MSTYYTHYLPELARELAAKVKPFGADDFHTAGDTRSHIAVVDQDRETGEPGDSNVTDHCLSEDLANLLAMTLQHARDTGQEDRLIGELHEWTEARLDEQQPTCQHCGDQFDEHKACSGLPDEFCSLMCAEQEHRDRREEAADARHDQQRDDDVTGEGR